MRETSGHKKPRIDAAVGNRFIEVKVGVTALRSVREGLVQLAYGMAERPESRGYLVLPDVEVTRERLVAEWKLAASVLRPDLLGRLGLYVGEGDRFVGIPRDPDPETQRIISRIVAAEWPRAGPRVARADAWFVVFKILLQHWLTNGEPVTTNWLARTSGYSYPSVANVLRSLGSLIERQSDRRIRLRWFPRDEFARLLALSDRARETVRFVDRSGQPRPPAAHLRRLEKLNPPNLAIGGVLGATHHFPKLDLVGIPRLDLSQHCPDRHADLRFVEKLDPALKGVDDPLAPASLAIHVVRHDDSLFTPRKEGLFWADPLECLLDLHEAQLEAQTGQFLEALQRRRPTPR